jgi:LysM repeat protein
VNKLFRIIMSVMLMVFAGMGVAEASSYTVMRGDTLSAIAVAHNTTVRNLVTLNKIANPDRIYAGQTIKIEGTVAARNHVAATNKTVESHQSATTTSLPEQCPVTQMIARAGFPTTVADRMVALVTETPQINPITVSTRDREYTIEYSDSCVVAGIERTLTSVASVRTDEEPTSPTNEQTVTTSIDPSSPAQQDESINPRDEMRKFLTNALGPPYDVGPIIERMDANAQMEAWGIMVI